MANNVRGGMTAGRHIPLQINRAKYGPKIDKNSHFLAKNGPNDPKFGLEVYLSGLY